MEKPNLDDKKYRYFHKKLGKMMLNNQKYWADCEKYGEFLKEQAAKTAAINAMKEHAKKTQPPYNCPSTGKCIYPECGCEWNL